jgi:hypothetical protein
MPKTEAILLYVPDKPIGTSLWVSEGVYDLLVGGGLSDSVQREKMLRRLRFLCDSNLRIHMPDTVKKEYGKTYCIHLDQYRLVGFFDESYRDFICLDYFVKKTQKNDRRMNAVYRRIDQIREAGAWNKAN